MRRLLPLPLCRSIFLAGLAWSALQAPAVANSGGPDAAGYSWADTTSGCARPDVTFGPGAMSFVGANDVVGPFPLGFTIPFFGEAATEIWVSPHGYVTFSDQGPTSGVLQTLADAAAPNHLIAVHWVPTGPADITVEMLGDSLHVGWNNPGLSHEFHLFIHDHGGWTMNWPSSQFPSDVVVGYEDRTGAVGTTLTRLQGFIQIAGDSNFRAPVSNLAACITAPVALDCSSPTPASCGQSVASSLPMAATTPASIYRCTPDTYLGNEVVFQVDIATPNQVSVMIDNPNLDILHVAQCDMSAGESTCTAVGDDRLDFPILFAGTYWFVVDKLAAGGGDAFNFDVTCNNPFQAVNCGDTVAGDTTGGLGIRDDYGCATSRLTGPEALYRVTLPTQDLLSATLSSAVTDLWVAIFDAATFDSGSPICLAAGRGGAGVFDAPAGDYVIVVDGENGAAGPYMLDIGCGPQLDCSTATVISCTETVVGDTTGTPSTASVYECSNETLSAGEDVYRFFNPVEQTITIEFRSSVPGQRLLLLPACNEGTCYLADQQSVSCALFPPGDYIVIVDGPAGAEGPYEFDILCSEFFTGVDLRITSIDARPLAGSCDNFDVSGDAIVTVTNLGTQPAVAPFDVVVFEDETVDGVLNAGDDELGRVTVSTDIAPGATEFINVTSNGTLAFRDNVIHAVVDDANTVAEVDENNNYWDTGRSCEFRPPIGNFALVSEWEWTGANTTNQSNFEHVDTLPLVADINADTTPDVIINSGSNAPGFGPGIVRVLDGATGGEIWTSTVPVYATSNLAAGDITGDGNIEIVAHSNTDTNTLVALDNTGALLWTSQPFLNHPMLARGGGGASIADIDCDGNVEVVWGANVFEGATGAYFWMPQPTGTIGANGFGEDGALSVVVDIDGNGTLEVVAGPTAYEYDQVSGMGQIVWRNTAVPDGFPAVGNFDGDDLPEIAITANGSVYLLEGDTGALIWQRAIPTGGGGCFANGVAGGPPTVADFDGDCAAEVGVAGADWYVVLETDGTVKWTAPINDCSSHRTASSVFDFDGDGAAEVAFMDQTLLHVFRGTDGSTITTWPTASHTWHEMIAIADVDADNNAEIIMPRNGGLTGVEVLGDFNDNWVNTRRIWNQHQYHISNVNDDGTIPGALTTGSCEVPSWRIHNTYRDQIGTSIYSAPDLTVSIINVEVILNVDCSRSLRIEARFGNGGGIEVGSASVAWFYEDAPPPMGTPLEFLVVPDLRPGEFIDSVITVPFPRFGQIDIFAVADDSGFGMGAVNECREDNNVCSVQVTNSPAPLNPPYPVGNALRATAHGSPFDPMIWADFNWLLDEGLNPPAPNMPRVLGTGLGEEHYHVVRGTSPTALVQLSSLEPYLMQTYRDSTPQAMPGQRPLVHFYKVFAADNCEQEEQP